MNKKNIFTFIGIYTFICGLAFLTLPNQLMSLYGAVLDNHASFVTRYMGIWILGMAFVFWPMRKAESIKTAVAACINAGLVITILGVLVSIWDIVLTSSTGVWINVAVYGVPLILLLFLFFKKEV